MHVREGNKVQVISGKDKGKQGTILATFPKENRVIVEGVNIVKKHAKPSQANPQGGVITKEAPIHVSNVMPLDPKTGLPTRVGSKTVVVKSKDGKDKKVRVRIAKKSGEEIKHK